MKNSIAVFTLLLLAISLRAQTPTWSDDIAQLVYDKCGTCHHNGGIAPFSLLTYNDAFLRKTLIQSNVVSKNMPPWHADDSYQDYAHKRSLTQAEITLIDDWVNAGAPEGTAANTPPPPVYSSGYQLSNPDLVLRAPVYTSKATALQDEYVCFSIPTGLVNNKKIKAAEFVPGNSSIVHHCLVYIDDTGVYPTDTNGFCAGPSSADLLMTYAPGEFPTIYPNGNNVKMGYTLPAGANIVFAMHYPGGSLGAIDSSKLHLFFYDDTTTIREVSSYPVLEELIFCINPNTTDTISSRFPAVGALPNDYSLLSIFPHGHLLAQSFWVYAIDAANDTIPLIRIPSWDFEWQGYYMFKNPVKLPAGSRLYGHGTYDNTTNNPFNPNQPPQTVCQGENTDDEMFKVYFRFLPYQTGDETLDLDSLTQPPSTGVHIEEAQGSAYLMAYPSPFNDQLQIEYYLNARTDVSLSVYDLQGRLVKTLVQTEQEQGLQRVAWDGNSTSVQNLPNGIYLICLRSGDQISTKKVFLSR